MIHKINIDYDFNHHRALYPSIECRCKLDVDQFPTWTWESDIGTLLTDDLIRDLK